MKVAKKVVLFADGMPTGVEWQWADGRKAAVMLADIPAEMTAYFLANGVSQKFGDCYAGANSVDEARGAWADLVAQVMEDKTWAKKGGAGSGSDLLIEALMVLLQEVDREVIEAKVKAMNGESLKALKKREDVKFQMDKIRLERKAKRLGDVTEFVDDLKDMF